jgi:acyl-CoA synthetase (AMP-forming)/AMP-acid ligase II
MLGQMQDHPLLISMLLDVCRQAPPPRARSSRAASKATSTATPIATWPGAPARWPTRWTRAGLGQGDRVATLAWNGYRHLELYFGVTGSGRVVHTLNPRLHPEQLVWIINHAEDAVLCFDMSFLPLIQAVHAKCPTVKTWVALCDADKLPEGSGIPNLLSYEAWIGGASDHLRLAAVRREQRRRPVLHQRHHGQPQGRPVQPPLHRAARLRRRLARRHEPVGARLDDAGGADVPRQRLGPALRRRADRLQAGVPRPAMDGKSLYELMEAEGVTMAAGVPTIWQMLLAHVQGAS